MAGFSSQAGHVILRTQAVQGTFQADLTTLGVAMKLRSGGLGSDRDLLVPDPEIGGTRDIQTAYLGAVKWSGDYEFYCRVESFMTLLYAALGVSATPTTTTGITTYSFTPSDGAALPYLSIEELIGASLECYDYTDCVVNTLHLEADANGYLMGTAGMISAKQVAGITPTSVTSLLDNLPLIVGTNITFTYNGVALAAKSFKFDLNNNFEDSDFRLGSFYLGSLVPKRREVTLSVNIREQDSTIWRQAVYGLSSATSPGGVTTQQQVVVTLLTYENIVGGTPTTAQTITMTFPKVILKPYNFGPNADDVIDNDVDMEVVRPASGTPLMTVGVKTGRATVA